MSDKLDGYNTDIEGYDKFDKTDSSFPKLHIDALAELGNIGAGAASIALSKFLNRDVSMSLPYINILGPKDLSHIILFKKEQFNKDEVVLICSNAVSPNNFSILCVIDKVSSHKLLKIIFPNLKNVNSISEYSSVQKSLLREMGSILILHYIAALNKLLDVVHEVDSPLMKIGKLMDSIKNICGINNNIKLGINLNIFTIENKILFDITIIPESNTINKFLRAMNVL